MLHWRGIDFEAEQVGCFAARRVKQKVTEVRMNDAAADAVTGLTLELVERARAIRWSSAPQDVRDLARQCLLDWIGVTLAAAGDPLARLLLDDALAEGGTPAASLVGHAERVTASQAALINGATSHVLDYDDVNLSLTGHPSA